MTGPPYTSFYDLQAERPPTDWRITAVNRHTPLLVAGIHAGGIEAGCTEVVLGVAGVDMAGEQYSSYLFEGLLSSGNSVLHIPSINFDEPMCLWMLSQCMRVISIHGASGSTPMVYVGGRDALVRDRVISYLNLAGFPAQLAASGLDGGDPANIVNRGLSGMGTQVELSTAFRSLLFSTNTAAERWKTRTAYYYQFVRVLREAVAVDSVVIGGA